MKEESKSTLIFATSTILIFMVTMIATVGMLWFAYHAQRNALLKIAENRQQVEFERTKQMIEEELRSITSDLLFLVQSSALYSFFETGETTFLENDFLAFSQCKKCYDQVRYLDDSGMEKVRVNFDQGEPRVVEEDELQNKAKRYYFKDVYLLDEGRIFVSPLDLNIEHGTLEVPFKPMLRFGTPVFDSKGKRRGIILLNYLAEKLLKQLGDDFQLLNRQGYWLHHRNPELCWGFMLQKPENNFAKQKPTVWSKIISHEKGMVLKTDKTFFFKTVRPLAKEVMSSSGSGQAYEKSLEVFSGKRYFWKLVTVSPNSKLEAGITVLRRNFLFLGGASGFILLILALILGRVLSQRYQAYALLKEREHRLALANRKLEESLANVKVLEGLLPVCAACKKVRDDKGYWNQIDHYLIEHVDARITHSICPECAKRLYGDFLDDQDDDNKEI